MNDQHRPRRAKGGVVSAPSGTHGTRRGAAGQKPERKRRLSRKSRITLIVLSILAVLAIVAAAVVYSYVNRLQTVFQEERNVIEELDSLDDETAYRTAEGTINILLMGSDNRGADEDDYRARTGEEGERSDSMMLVHIPADRSGVYVMSIMRDLWVEVPGHGQGRINSALSAGGLDLAVDTVENLLYTHIDHVVTIDFDGFEDLTAALGGVYVDNPRSFSAGQINPSFYPEGTIRLEGSEALRFVRERQSFPMSDYVRVENQQLVMRAIAERFLSGDTLTNPDRVLDVLEAILPYMEMDTGLDQNTIISYALDMTSLRSRDIHTFTMPAGEPHTTSAGAEVILPDEEMMTLLQRSLSSENMDGFMAYMTSLEDAENGTFTVTEDEEPLGVQVGRLIGEGLNRED
ncbi:LCP family protein [Nesterenkonia muleiensis]|uniref:LCP family protein n=1 Tax=Nesterenkonia muleiensis TaxID=2282648 RepID=UPI001300848C|nr:LCP family protein [Nesterenkonia muleiensis]